MKGQILVYKGAGANPRCLRALGTQLRGLAVQLIDHTYLDESWENETALLIFPGGRDVLYHNTLKGSLNARIRAFVDRGGYYLGICAGAYYGSQIVEFEPGQSLEVIDRRELAFFPGKALGPAYGLGQFQYDTEAGARIASLTLDAGQPSAAYFNGGCAFLEADQHPSVHILARYQDIPDQPAAVIECQVGKGLAILSGVHPEYSIPICQKSEQQRKELFVLLLARLGFNVAT